MLKEMKTLTPSILAFYLGCECQYTDEDKNVIIAPLLAVNLSSYAWFVDPEFDEAIEIKDVTPLLRKLSSMTEDDAREYMLMDPSFSEIGDFEIMEIKSDYIKFSTGKLRQGNGYVYEAEEGMPLTWHTSKQFTYLLSKHFDLFNLIENNLAIDKDKLK